MFLSVSESRLLLSTLEAQHPPTCPSLFHPFVTVIRTKFIDLSTKREMSYHQPGAPLFSFRGEKRFRVFQPPQRRHPFSPIFFFLVFHPFSEHALSLSRSPSSIFLSLFFSFVGHFHSEKEFDSSDRSEYTYERYRYCVICSEFSLENLTQLGENKIYIIYFGYFFRWNRGTPCMCMDRY